MRARAAVVAGGTEPAAATSEALAQQPDVNAGIIEAHERGLTSMALETLTARYGNTVRVIGPGTVINRGSVISLDVENVHPHDLGQILDEFGVCVRPGHHCAKPLMRILGVPATSRASTYLYNDERDIDALIEALGRAEAFFAL